MTLIKNIKLLVLQINVIGLLFSYKGFRMDTLSFT